jgi:hypothetical protein
MGRGRRGRTCAQRRRAEARGRGGGGRRVRRRDGVAWRAGEPEVASLRDDGVGGDVGGGYTGLSAIVVGLRRSFLH